MKFKEILVCVEHSCCIVVYFYKGRRIHSMQACRAILAVVFAAKDVKQKSTFCCPKRILNITKALLYLNVEFNNGVVKHTDFDSCFTAASSVTTTPFVIHFVRAMGHFHEFLVVVLAIRAS